MSSHLIRSDLIPVLGGYLILMTVLAVALRAQRRRAADGRSTARRARAGDQGWRCLARHVLADVLGGYLLLAAVVVLYYYGVARVGGSFLASEFSGSAVLLALCLPVFAAASWLAQAGAGGPARRTRPDRAGAA